MNHESNIAKNNPHVCWFFGQDDQSNWDEFSDRPLRARIDSSKWNQPHVGICRIRSSFWYRVVRCLHGAITPGDFSQTVFPRGWFPNPAVDDVYAEHLDQSKWYLCSPSVGINFYQVQNAIERPRALLFVTRNSRYRRRYQGFLQ